MRKLFYTASALISAQSFAQFGVNTASPKGVLDASNKLGQNYGMVLPRVSSAEATTTPNGTPIEVGTVVYDMAARCIKIRNESSWSKCFMDFDGVKTLTGNPTTGPITVGNLSTLSNNWVLPAPSTILDPIQISLIGTTTYSTNFADALDENVLQGVGYSAWYATGSNYIINPTKRLFNKKIFSISSGQDSHLIIDDAFNLYGIGYNYNTTTNNLMGVAPTDQYGQLLKQYTKIPLNLLANEHPLQAIILGTTASAILTNLGNVYTTGGAINNGQGTNVKDYTNPTTTGTDKAIFTKIAGLSNIKSIWGERMGVSGAITAISNSNEVYVWGTNAAAGIPKTYVGAEYNTLYAPVNITDFFNNSKTPSWPANETVKKLLVKNGFTVALTNSGKLYGTQGVYNTRKIGLDITGYYTVEKMNIWHDLSTTFPDIESAEKIIDFDCVDDAIMAISRSKIWYTGYDGYERFGNGADQYSSDTWKRLSTDQFATAKFTNIKMTPYRTLISTSRLENEGAGRVIGAGYTYQGAMGNSGPYEYIYNARYIVR